MALPIVAVVGRPNVGKSTLFNKLIGQRLSIVEDTPGVTRDRIYSKCEWRDKQFMVVDTGGIEPDSNDVILAQMRRQSQLAIDKADVITLVTDIRCGGTADDYAVADMLQKSGKPVVLCVNKVDSLGEPPLELYEFYNLGLGEPFPVSSVHGHGTGDMLDEIYNLLPSGETDDYDDDYEDTEEEPAPKPRRSNSRGSQAPKNTRRAPERRSEPKEEPQVDEDDYDDDYDTTFNSVPKTPAAPAATPAASSSFSGKVMSMN